MATILSFRYVSRAALALSALSGAALPGVGCSSDQNVKPRDPVIIGTGGAQDDGGGTGGKSNSTGGRATGGSGGSGASGGPDSSTGAAGSAGSDDGGSSGGSPGGGSDASPGDSGSGGSSTECTPSTGTEGCFNCPSTTEQFLHQCTTPDVQCSPFDNGELGLFHGYPLPAVP